MKVIFATNEHHILNDALTSADAGDRLLSFYYLQQLKNPTEVLKDIATLGAYRQQPRIVRKEIKNGKTNTRKGLS